jgi:TolB protein
VSTRTTIGVWIVAAALAGGGAPLLASRKKVADGTYTIAFGSFAPVRPQVFIADGNGDHAKPLLANPAVDYNASFSRDGAWVVFTSERSGSADIYRVHPDGSGLERLTNDPGFDDQAVLSPDGRTLAFVSTRGGAANIWLPDLITHALTNLTKGSAGDFRPAWSPDGEWIAFSSDRDLIRSRILFAVNPATQIYVMRKDGRDVRRLTTSAVSAGSPSWSPDGSHVVHYQVAIGEAAAVPLSTARFAPASPPNAPRPDMKIVSTDLRTGAVDMLTSGPSVRWSPRWLSAGGIAYVSGGETGGVERINGTPGARGEYGNPSWSTDGTMMVFHRETDAAWPPFQPWTTLDRGFRLVRTGIFPSYSPSGDRLVCNSGIAGITHNSILIMNADGSNRRVLFDESVAERRGAGVVAARRSRCLCVGPVLPDGARPGQGDIATCRDRRRRTRTAGAGGGRRSRGLSQLVAGRHTARVPVGGRARTRPADYRSRDEPRHRADERCAQ